MNQLIFIRFEDYTPLPILVQDDSEYRFNAPETVGDLIRSFRSSMDPVLKDYSMKNLALFGMCEEGEVALVNEVCLDELALGHTTKNALILRVTGMRKDANKLSFTSSDLTPASSSLNDLRQTTFTPQTRLLGSF